MIPSEHCTCGEPRSDRDVALVIAYQPTGEHFHITPKRDKQVARLIARDEELSEVELRCCVSCCAVYARPSKP